MIQFIWKPAIPNVMTSSVLLPSTSCAAFKKNLLMRYCCSASHNPLVMYLPTINQGPAFFEVPLETGRLPQLHLQALGGRSTTNGSCSQPPSWLFVKVQAKPASSLHLYFGFWIPNGICVVNSKSDVVNWLPLWRACVSVWQYLIVLLPIDIG